MKPPLDVCGACGIALLDAEYAEESIMRRRFEVVDRHSGCGHLISYRSGGRSPLRITSSGRALIELPQGRAQDHAVERAMEPLLSFHAQLDETD